MAATPFKALNWSPNEMISKEKLDQQANNTQWLFENTPRALYTLPGGLRRQEGVKIAAGRAKITPRKTDSAMAEVRFGNFFSSNCEPIITTGIVATGQRKIFVIVNGYGRLHPDHRGFQAIVEVAADIKKSDRIATAFYVTWQALGY